MRAWHLDDESPIEAATLLAEDIYYETFPPGAHQPGLDALAASQGYIEQDVVVLHPDTPNLDAICAKFVDEHLHDDDEVRFVLEGEGIFDIRSGADRWMRVLVEPGDLIVVPAGRHHRFLLTDARMIRCVRLFKDAAGWVPHYREGA